MSKFLWSSTSGVYSTHVASSGLCGLHGPYTLVEPDEADKDRIHQVIYDTGYGIKAPSAPVTSQALEALSAEALRLHARGAEAVIMGCTEIPLALDNRVFPFPLIDPTLVLARALIRAARPTHLRHPQCVTAPPPGRQRPRYVVV